MREFAFLFRATRPVAPEDLPRRNTAARDWALARRDEGSLSSASPLEDESVTIAAEGVSRPADAQPVAAVLVIRAHDLEAAVTLARTHPGLAFGTQIEVRPVKPLQPIPR